MTEKGEGGSILAAIELSFCAGASSKWYLGDSAAVCSTFSTDDLLSQLFFRGLPCGNLSQVDVVLWYLKKFFHRP